MIPVEYINYDRPSVAAMIGYFFVASLVGITIWATASRIIALEKQKRILIDNYLGHISEYRRPLWANEKEKREFEIWLEDTTAGFLF